MCFASFNEARIDYNIAGTKQLDQYYWKLQTLLLFGKATRVLFLFYTSNEDFYVKFIVLIRSVEWTQDVYVLLLCTRFGELCLITK